MYNRSAIAVGGEEMKKKITISIDKELIKKLDEYAKRHYIDRTSAICVLLSDALDEEELYFEKPQISVRSQSGTALTEDEIEEIIEQSNFL